MAAVSTADRVVKRPVQRSRKRSVPSPAVAKRSYGSGRLFVYTDKAGAESWYGSWRVGGRRVQRKIGAKREVGGTYGLTRVQAERELRRRMESDLVVATPERKTLGEAASLHVDHLENVMERKGSTIQDYRGYVRAHFKPFFGDVLVDRVDPPKGAAYLKHKRADGLSAKTLQNHLNFLHGVFAHAVKRGWAASNPVARVDRPKMESPLLWPVDDAAERLVGAATLVGAGELRVRGWADDVRGERVLLVAVAAVSPLGLVAAAKQARAMGASEVHACGVAVSGLDARDLDVVFDGRGLLAEQSIAA